MHPATSTQHDSHADAVWFGMEIPRCAEGCGTVVTRTGETCRPCASATLAQEHTARSLIATLLDRGVPVTREAVAA